MKLKILDEVFEITKGIEEIEQICSQRIDGINTMLSSYIVDGEVEYKQIDEWFNQSIKLIEVIVQTKEEVIDDIINSVSQYLSQSIWFIEKYIDDYTELQTKINYVDVSEGISYIIDSCSTIEKECQGRYNIRNEVNGLVDILKKLVEAFENDDIVFLRDILKYELIVTYNNLFNTFVN